MTIISNNTLPVEFEGGKYVSSDDFLICPVCKGGSLHHTSVSVHYVEKEDAPSNSVTTDGRNVTFNSPAAPANPSYRRDGVTIRFWCESCDSDLHLGVAQHKGSTYVGWAKVVSETGRAWESLRDDDFRA